jgi:hypothetical protein
MSEEPAYLLESIAALKGNPLPGYRVGQKPYFPYDKRDIFVQNAS